MRLTRAKSLIGLDIGTHSVKAVELTWSNGPVITGFGYAELPSPDAVPDVVLDLLRDNEFHSRRVVTSVSGRSVIVRYLTMFKMSPDDLRNAIRYEADKYIPFDVDDVVLDCQPFEVEGVGTLNVDIAYGGDSFVIVEAPALGFEIAPHEARDIVEAGVKITASDCTI